MKSTITQQFTLWEEERLFYLTSKGRAYSVNLVTRKCIRISLSEYETYLEIYHS